MNNEFNGSTLASLLQKVIEAEATLDVIKSKITDMSIRVDCVSFTIDKVYDYLSNPTQTQFKSNDDEKALF
jgi:hypothetical protein